MIKIKLRKNLLYLLVYYISWYTRKIIDIIIGQIFDIFPSLLYLYLMILGEIIGGFSLFIYQYPSLNKNEQTKYFKIKLIHNKKKDTIGVGKIKRILLIFFAAFFDFYEFVFGSVYVPLINPNISPTIDSRLGSLQTVVSSLICSYSLDFKVKKHHKVSLIVITSCLLLTLIFEIIFKQENISLSRFIFSRFLICYYLIGNSLNSCIEKYLVDTDFINPFKILMFEGIFEIIMAIFISLGEDPFKEIINQYETNSTGYFILLIFLLFLHFLLSMMVNAYKIYCNVIYTPMARAFSDYFMNQFFNIYYFISENDFNNNYAYFFISEILCIITNFFCCIYNEYVILFLCGLEHDTKEQIIERAPRLDIQSLTSYDEQDDDSDENNNSENSSEMNNTVYM